MTFTWIFKDRYERSIDVVSSGFASIQPIGPAGSLSVYAFQWTIDNRIAINAATDGPMIITFKNPVVISSYRILTKLGLRYMKGWNISVSSNGNKFDVIDARKENLCDKEASATGGTDCGETTDKIYNIPTVKARKIKLEPTVLGSFNTYDIHICAFDVFGTTKGDYLQHSCNISMKSNFFSICFIIIMFIY